jgi:hypothetical protein
VKTALIITASSFAYVGCWAFMTRLLIKVVGRHSVEEATAEDWFWGTFLGLLLAWGVPLVWLGYFLVYRNGLARSLGRFWMWLVKGCPGVHLPHRQPKPVIVQPRANPQTVDALEAWHRQWEREHDGTGQRNTAR